MAIVAFPSWAYNSAGQPATIVQSQAQLNALTGPGTWAFTPFPVPSPPTAPPLDSLTLGTGTFTATDTRLQQMLIEMRMQNMMIAQAFGITEDPQTLLRPDVLANDAGLTS